MALLRQLHHRISFLSPTTHYLRASSRTMLCSTRNYSDSSSKSSNPASGDSQKPDEKSSEELKPRKKTQAELDAELMAKLQAHDSEGGAAGVEYEDGKPASMKRSVRNNMFRYI